MWGVNTSVYLRQEFTLEEPLPTELLLYMKYDDGAEWSALNKAEFSVGTANLRITEIMYLWVLKTRSAPMLRAGELPSHFNTVSLPQDGLPDSLAQHVVVAGHGTEHAIKER